MSVSIVHRYRAVTATRKSLVLVLLVFFLGACANNSRELYYWGSYEDMLYTMYKKPGDASPEKQVERLSRDLERAAAAGRPAPPGLYAHLGVMYAALGNSAKAEQAFLEEKARFPESSVLIDGMLSRSRDHQGR